LIKSLGKGAMGEVTLGEDTKLDRKVAIKTMRPDVEMSSKQAIEMRHRFVREAKTAGKLTHPNIVTIYDSFEGEDGVAYIVMEYVEGGTLTSFMKAARLSVPQIKHVIINAAKKLHHARENGVFHRDVKPDAMMISPETGVVKVMDFGIRQGGRVEMTATGSIFGTPAYMSPEQVSGQKVVGKRPFTGSSPTEMMFSIIQKDPPAPLDRRPRTRGEPRVGSHRAQGSGEKARTALPDRQRVRGSRPAVPGEIGPLFLRDAEKIPALVEAFHRETLSNLFPRRHPRRCPVALSTQRTHRHEH
jgi:serine/threonine-protein kinase